MATPKEVYRNAREIYNTFLSRALQSHNREAPESYAEDHFERRHFHIALAERLKPRMILDIGCGVGEPTLSPLHERGYRVVGLDISDSHLAFCRGLDVVLGDAHHLPFPNDSFDLVVATEILEHVAYPDLVLEEAKRVSSRWGLFSVPHQLDEPDNRIHLRKFDRESFLSLVGAHMKVVSACYIRREHHPDPCWPGWWEAVAAK